MPAGSVTSPTLRRLSLTKPVSSCPIRVGTGTDHFAAPKADYEGGDYSPEAEAAVRAYERNRAELARQAEAGETAKPEREAEQRAIDDASAGSLPKSIWNDLGKLIIEAGAEPQHYLMCRRKAVFHGYHADGTTRMDETLTSSPSL
jgi:hypothetical protein